MAAPLATGIIILLIATCEVLGNKITMSRFLCEKDVCNIGFMMKRR